jgi:hypothetical protein
MCDAYGSEGWRLYREPTPEMRSVFKAEKVDEGEIKWFKNKDGRIRVCKVYPKHDCAEYYATHDPLNAEESETIVTTCPNPY